MPDASALPRERWRPVVEGMAKVAKEFGLEPKVAPAESDAALRWLEEHAPESVLDEEPALVPSPLAFAATPLGLPPELLREGRDPPRIAHLHLCDLDEDGHLDVLVSDIQHGFLTCIHRTASGALEEAVLAEIAAPARVALADLDGDGDRDIAVADLGSIAPTEEAIGSVVLLENRSTPSEPLRFEARTVLSGVARVSDVRAGDLDQDGDLDLALGLFGLYKTGGAAWLERRPDGSYRRHDILKKNGVSHVPLADFDRDGRLDVLALVSQEHEEIVLFLNRGRGQFEAYLVFKAPHPLFGLSNCELVDLDLDGDLDVLFANGDALDQDPFPKPWHGAHWLENRTPEGGRPTFQHRELVRFPGAYSAVPGDLDGDGDPDVVVTSMLNRWEEPDRQSLIWLENRRAEGFAAHPLDRSPTFLVTAAIGDLDGDGRSDVVAGGMYVLQPYYRVGRVTLWLQGPPRAQ